MQGQYKTGFTLVELIVIITILSVLVTIGFISFSGYAISARDSVRLTDIKNIQKGLGILKAKSLKYPIPDNKIDITSSGTILNYQGYAGKVFLGTLGVNGGGIDPLTNEYYTITTNISRTKYQLLSYFENEKNITQQAINISKTYADSKRYLQLSGDKLGIILSVNTKEPIQKEGINIDISEPTSNYEVYISTDEIITGENVSLGGLYSKSSCKRLKEFNNDLMDGKYMIDPLANGYEFEVVCDMTTDGGGWTLYTAKNKYDYPDIGYFSLDSRKQNIKFQKIRWNFISPQGKHFPLIYTLFNQKEGNLLLEHNEGIQNNIYINEMNHYKNTQDFVNAFSLGKNDTSGIDFGAFKNAYKNYNMTHFGAWVDGLGRNINFLGTSYAYNKTLIKDIFWFPSNPYNGTYRIGEETFSSLSTNAHWLDGRSIAIWIK